MVGSIGNEGRSNSYSRSLEASAESLLKSVYRKQTVMPTDAEIEAGARAIAMNVNSPNCIKFPWCAAGEDCACREDARLAIAAAEAVRNRNR
jgi:hypothetical protein